MLLLPILDDVENICTIPYAMGIKLAFSQQKLPYLRPLLANIGSSVRKYRLVAPVYTVNIQVRFGKTQRSNAVFRAVCVTGPFTFRVLREIFIKYHCEFPHII